MHILNEPNNISSKDGPAILQVKVKTLELLSTKQQKNINEDWQGQGR